MVKCRQRCNRMYLPVSIFFCFHDNQISQNSQIQRNEVSTESQIYSSCSTSILASLAEDSQPEMAAKVHVNEIRKPARSTDDNGFFEKKTTVTDENSHTKFAHCIDIGRKKTVTVSRVDISV